MKIGILNLKKNITKVKICRIITSYSLRLIIMILSIIFSTLLTHSFWEILLISGSLIICYIIFFENKLIKYIEK